MVTSRLGIKPSPRRQPMVEADAGEDELALVLAMERRRV
jgi:hypothetical protein